MNYKEVTVIAYLIELFKRIDAFFNSAQFKNFSPFVLGILSRWYLIICIPAITATYYALKGLSESGLLGKIENFITENLKMLVEVSRVCSPKIANLREFLQCLGL
ncbi:hypothetical protein NOVO_07980 [Rickettsiales bacterium Ac37b]|nr:hypothetical protein NOVO_07980 [Rickettsiales bacterium Ac37b]